MSIWLQTMLWAMKKENMSEIKGGIKFGHAICLFPLRTGGKASILTKKKDLDLGISNDKGC